MDAPSAAVVEAFGGDPVAVEQVSTGSGGTWRAGPIALKRGEPVGYVEWMGALTDALAGQVDLRIAAPRRATDGAWMVDGWWAMDWLAGSHLPDVWDRALDVAHAFHGAIATAGVESPDVIRELDSPWRVGDAVAWRERTPETTWPNAVVETLERLSSYLDATYDAEPRQPVHLDIGGNILFADDEGLPPAVIDLSIHDRPPPYADAVLVADAVAWGGASAALAVGYLARRADGDQLLARAIAFRIATAAVAWPDHPLRAEAEVDGYRPLIALLA